MENKLEQLLNSLIEKGWKPFGRNSNKAYYRPEWPDEFYFGENWYGYIYNWRQVVSKESWLWQFVCENKLYKDYTEDSGTYWDSTIKIYNYREYQYRLIESSLKDESELGDFLLQNIKIDEKDNM